MKRPLLFLLCVLSLLMPGCGGYYPAEQMLWRLQDRHRQTLKYPAAADDKEFKATVHALQNIVDRFHDWEQSPELRMNIARMYAERKDYVTAQDKFTQVIISYPENKELCAQADFSKGRLYEMNNDWVQALKQYKEVIRMFGSTPTGLKTPLYIAAHFRQNDMNDEYKKACDEAIDTYRGMIDDAAYSKSTPVIFQYLLNAYAAKDDWEDAAADFQKIALRYPDSYGAPYALYRSANIWRDMLKKPGKAIELFQRIVKNYPTSGAIRSAAFELGNTFLVVGDIEKAKQVFSYVTEQYKNDATLGAQSCMVLARAYENAGKWEEAIAEYKRVDNVYPSTLEYLRVPVFVAEHYRQANQAKQVDAASGEAYSRCMKVIKAHNASREQVKEAYHIIADIFSMQNRWNESIAALKTLSSRYPDDAPTSAVALYQIADIYAESLNDRQRAAFYYRMLAGRYPDHSLALAAREKLRELYSVSRSTASAQRTVQ
jgi:tetratricopeptide (TPR) repeat protein